MSTNNAVKYGLTSWDEVEIKQNSFQKSGPDQYMRLENGDNLVRCVTKPHQYLVHTYKEDGDPGFGEKIYCSQFHKSCPLCEEGNKPKRRWFVGVIDRKTQTYKILDMSVTVFKTIQEYSRDEDYGSPEKFDINIKVDKAAPAAGYYTVIAKPPKAMSANDLSIKEEINPEDLMKKCTPPTPEKVVERLAAYRAKVEAKLEGKAASRPANKVASKPRVAPVVAPVDMHGSTDDDFVFEPVNS
jgi:hypothetical protein